MENITFLYESNQRYEPVVKDSKKMKFVHVLYDIEKALTKNQSSLSAFLDIECILMTFHRYHSIRFNDTRYRWASIYIEILKLIGRSN